MGYLQSTRAERCTDKKRMIADKRNKRRMPKQDHGGATEEASNSECMVKKVIDSITFILCALMARRSFHLSDLISSNLKVLIRLISKNCISAFFLQV